MAAPRYTKVVAKTAQGLALADHSPLINPLIGCAGGYAVVATLGEWPSFELVCFSRKVPSFGFASANPGEGAPPLLTAKLLAKILARHKDYQAKVRQLDGGGVALVVGQYSAQRREFTAVFHSFPLAPAPAADLIVANAAYIYGHERRRLLRKLQKKQRLEVMAALAQLVRSAADGGAGEKLGDRETNNK